MSSERLIALWKKETLQLWRDPLLLLLILSIVTLQLILFGYAADSKIKNIPLVYYDQDQTAVSRRLVRSFLLGDYFKLEDQVDKKGELIQALRLGKAQVGVEIPEDFSKNMISGKSFPINIYLDGAQANTAQLAKRYLVRDIKNFLERDPLNGFSTPDSEGIPELKTNVTFLYNPKLKDSFFMIPGAIGVILSVIVTVLAAAVFAREKEYGTIASLQVSPVHPLEFFLGKLIPVFFLASINGVIGYLVAWLVFDIPFSGSLSLLIVASIAFILFSIAVGHLTARFSRSQFQAIVTSLIVVFPEIFLSGGMGSSANWPVWLRGLAWANPLYYYVRLSRGSLVLGEGWLQLWFPFFLLFGVTVILLAFSLKQAGRFFSEAAPE